MGLGVGETTGPSFTYNIAVLDSQIYYQPIGQIDLVHVELMFTCFDSTYRVVVKLTI